MVTNDKLSFIIIFKYYILYIITYAVHAIGSVVGLLTATSQQSHNAALYHDITEAKISPHGGGFASSIITLYNHCCI